MDAEKLEKPSSEGDEKEEEESPNCFTKAYWCSWNNLYKTTAWGCLLFVYLLIGALIFVLLERPQEVRDIRAAREARENATATLVTSIIELSNFTLNESQALDVVYTFSNLSASLSMIPAETSPTWEYGPAVFFATTVVTTIGYGNISPSTSGGQSFFIVYAIIGIPICLIFLTGVGKMLSGGQDFIFQRFKCNKKSIGVRLLEFLIVTVFFLILLIIIPAIIFQAIEGWTYRESVYYCFVSLTTVGFGDFVPAQSTATRETEFSGSANHRGLYKICISCWIVIGLAVVALFITNVQNLLESLGKKMRTSCASCRKGKVELSTHELTETMEEISPAEKPVQVTSLPAE